MSLRVQSHWDIREHGKDHQVASQTASFSTMSLLSIIRHQENFLKVCFQKKLVLIVVVGVLNTPMAYMMLKNYNTQFQPCEADGCFRELPHVPMTLRLGSYYYALQLLSALSHPYHGAVTEVIDRAQALNKSDLHEPLHKVCLAIICCTYIVIYL